MCRSHAWPCPVLGCAQSDFLNVNPLCPLASGRASRPHGREDLICESQDQPGLVTVSLFRCHAVYPCPGQAENRRGAGQTQQFQSFKNIKELRVSIDGPWQGDLPSAWLPCHPSLMQAYGPLHISFLVHRLGGALLLGTKVETARNSSPSTCGREGGRFEPQDSKHQVLCLAPTGPPGASPHG